MLSCFPEMGIAQGVSVHIPVKLSIHCTKYSYYDYRGNTSLSISSWCVLHAASVIALTWAPLDDMWEHFIITDPGIDKKKDSPQFNDRGVFPLLSNQFPGNFFIRRQSAFLP
jgi:hypothetical protein